MQCLTLVNIKPVCELDIPTIRMKRRKFTYRVPIIGLPIMSSAMLPYTYLLGKPIWFCNNKLCLLRYIAKHNFVTVSRLSDFKLECNAKRNAVIGSYNIQSGQSQYACVASASKIPSEYTSVASTKNDNALTWPYNLKWRIHASFSFTFGMCFYWRWADRFGPFYLLSRVYAVILAKLFLAKKNELCADNAIDARISNWIHLANSILT